MAHRLESGLHQLYQVCNCNFVVHCIGFAGAIKKAAYWQQ
jgi:hypothetical protein